MKNLPLLFLGIFFTLAFSWVGIILTSHLTIGQLEATSSVLIRPDTGDEIAGVTYQDDFNRTVMGQSNLSEQQYPRDIVGLAKAGKEVYQNMGCLYCHSQQVRRKGYGADFERGWGDRQSVPRDYIRQDRVLLGTMRTGPDLMTVGQRLPDENWQHLHLYNPQITSKGSNMPPFAFLYDLRKIDDILGPSPKALALMGEFAPPEGYEVVPTPRAEALVAYLLSLKLDYSLPEGKLPE